MKKKQQVSGEEICGDEKNPQKLDLKKTQPENDENDDETQVHNRLMYKLKV